MKISNEQLAALTELEARKKSQAVDEGFAALLGGELGKATGPQSAGMSGAIFMPGQLAAPLAGVQGLGEVDGATAAEAAGLEMSTMMVNLLSGLDDYADKLAGGATGSLRDAFSLLENTTDQLSAMRSAFPDMENSHPELAAMARELDVLTTTEKFKFNRGDYL